MNVQFSNSAIFAVVAAFLFFQFLKKRVCEFSACRPKECKVCKSKAL